MSASLATLAAIVVLTLILPNYTVTDPGPVFAPSQLVFIAVVSLILYGTFVFAQIIRHRDYFLPLDADGNEEVHAAAPPGKVAAASALLLASCLVVVVLLAKSLAPSVEQGSGRASAHPTRSSASSSPPSCCFRRGSPPCAPRAPIGCRRASTLRSARRSPASGSRFRPSPSSRLRPACTLTLGIDIKSTVLLLLSLFVTAISLGTGRTTVLQGTVLLVIFATYLFTTIVP